MLRALALLAWLGAMGVWGVAQAAGNSRDCAECPEMVTVPAGSFMMGGAGNHKVTFVRPFALSATLVTQAQWKAVMGKNP
ncbi:MAG: SUMF1/EgtB/PvdO family nonheme iron enzyme, partial [Betaproteobacteria bacterium]|nr:SUMF1/EgtB/PvdO family nonheme iron enzyme [Betaproteobacteria bacterium]